MTAAVPDPTNTSWPPVLVLTDRHQAEAAGHRLDAVVTALAHLPVWVVLREKDLAAAPRRVLAERVTSAARSVGVEVLVASDVDLAHRVAARGVHLASDQAGVDRAVGFVGRSAHDLSEVADAVRHGVDYLTVSPVFATPSKPGYGPPLGLEGLAALTEASPLPVYALGGVDVHRAADCVRAGARGVAVMGEVMRAADPRRVAKALVAAVLDAQPPVLLPTALDPLQGAP